MRTNYNDFHGYHTWYYISERLIQKAMTSIRANELARAHERYIGRMLDEILLAKITHPLNPCNM